MEARSQAPWVSDKALWGRVRYTEKLWAANYIAVKTYLEAKWKIHHGFAEGSEERRDILKEISTLQKVAENLEGLAREKGWDVPGSSTGT